MKKVLAMVWTLAAATSLAAVPLAGAAPRPTPARIHGRAGRTDPAQAAVLRARAAELAKDRRHFHESAELYERAAALTPVEDGQRAHDLYIAANLLYDIGSPVGAQTDMVQSAEAALERGDVEAAADAFVSAAWVAAKRHNAAEARAYALRALHLAASPLLSESVRDRIRQRVVVSPTDDLAGAGQGKPVSHTGWSVAAQRTKAGPARPVRRAPRAEGAHSR